MCLERFQLRLINIASPRRFEVLQLTSPRFVPSMPFETLCLLCIVWSLVYINFGSLISQVNSVF